MDTSELELRELGIEVPRWVEQDVVVYTVRAVAEGGCGSGAYMPAVEGWTATQTMAEHGDDVLEYLADYADPFELDPVHQNWSGFASRVLEYAVNLWASQLADSEELAEALEEWAEHPHRAEARAAIAELRRRGFELHHAHDGAEYLHAHDLTRADELQAVEWTGLVRLYYYHEDGRRVGLFLVLGNGPGELIADGSWSQDPNADADLTAAMDAARRAAGAE